MTDVLIKKNIWTETLIKGRQCEETQGEASCVQTERRPGTTLSSQPLEGTNSTDTLILDSSLQNHGTIRFCCLSHPVCGTLLWSPGKGMWVLNTGAGGSSRQGQQGCLAVRTVLRLAGSSLLLPLSPAPLPASAWTPPAPEGTQGLQSHPAPALLLVLPCPRASVPDTRLSPDHTLSCRE